jgi:methionine biosynthesis protein MetW
MNQPLRTDLQLISQWIKPQSHVLDLGCGKGALLAYLQRQCQATGYGLEIDAANLFACLQAKVNVIQADLDQGLADFADNSFDYVIMTQTLQAMQNPLKILLDMVRVGKQGIVTFPNFGHWQARVNIGFGGYMPVSRVLCHQWYNTPNIHLCTIKDFEKLCRQHNIKILQRAVVDHAHQQNWRTRWWPNLLGEIALYQVTKA